MADEFVFGDTDGGVSFDGETGELTVWDTDLFPSSVAMTDRDRDQLITVLNIAKERRS